MSQDPASTFSGLLKGCISDHAVRSRRREALEGAALLMIGMASSLLTSYILASVGFLV